MATSKSLQKPTILSIEGSTIRVAHPDLSGYTRTRVGSPIVAAATSLTVIDNNNFENFDWFITGEVGDSKTEEGDVNGATTRGTALTITNTNKFGHEIDAPVTRIFERGITIYGAATDGGSGTIIESIDALTAGTNQLADVVMAQWDKPYTEFTLITTDTSYAFYYVVFSDGVTESSASDYVASTGPAYNSAYEIVYAGLREVDAEVDGELITLPWLLDVVNDWIEEVTHFVRNNGTSKDWTFELTEDKSSITALQNVEKYALSDLTLAMKYANSQQGVLQLKLGSETIEYIDLPGIEARYEGVARTEVATQASSGDTSIVLDDTYEFAESGSVFIGPDTVTYTANDESTGTLSGIPASGTGSITATRAVDTVVWQGVSPGKPQEYTIFNGKILLDRPCNANVTNFKFKLKYLYKLARLTSLSEPLVPTFSHIAKYYVAGRIESRKKNLDNAERQLAKHADKLEREAHKDRLQITEQLNYYRYGLHSVRTRNSDWRSWNIN